MPHPHASLANILTFMWCIWKSRNDCLFNRKKGEPYQIYINSHAILKTVNILETPSAFLRDKPKQILTNHENRKDGCRNIRLAEDDFTGTTIFSDASWKEDKMRNSTGSQYRGIGIFIQTKGDKGHANLKIQASTSSTLSVLQAGATAMLLAAEIAAKLQIQNPTLLTDNKLLAMAVADGRLESNFVHWNTREVLAKILILAGTLQARMVHIPRDKNYVAHRCAHKDVRCYSADE
uniref:Uncharacterized protein n=1 Tax=Avena sativa TaxID=4498 RepID=A0ACD5ZLW8_AVESA